MRVLIRAVFIMLAMIVLGTCMSATGVFDELQAQEKQKVAITWEPGVKRAAAESYVRWTQDPSLPSGLCVIGAPTEPLGIHVTEVVETAAPVDCMRLQSIGIIAFSQEPIHPVLICKALDVQPDHIRWLSVVYRAYPNAGDMDGWAIHSFGCLRTKAKGVQS